ncbi:putative deoxynucleotide monophosphate kinase [Caulobacter phage CcrBL10]|uniref:Putative deoxynucleotide monophosphate kinase n=1 Tax=Caulobacter phage CcrBL10 TaxID=2283269 RepID=A0A385EBS4_9CAUD|nr:putative deoxynucleotide monophosphate kinase [Caulobacter phage CcrBL10]AXQ68312.1 putative deoxynucleotide monophosphate kinase [Caulobacter phage CcrBL10]
MELVAITGKRGHGKSTAAARLEQAGYKHINFADPLREIARVAYGVTMEEMLDPILKEKVLDRYPFKSPRDILQKIGTEMFRSYAEDTWIEAFKRSAGDYKLVVCSDCRFLNEADAVRALGGMIIRVDDPRKVSTDAASQHASELEMEKIVPDWTIVNDRTIHDLHNAIGMIVLPEDQD